jgi:iron complex outermembrane receptor protein
MTFRTTVLALLFALTFGRWQMAKGGDSTAVDSMLTRSVIVSAIRADAQAPVTQATVDSLAISREMIGQDVQYVLERTTPSVVAYSESGTNVSNYGSFRLRGIDQTRVNVTLNGAPLNDMIDQGVFFSNITDLLNGMSSVQVQRGVGTTSNGTASFAGSVSIESPTPLSKRPAARLQFTGGSYGLLRGSAEATTGTFAEGLSASAKLSTFTTDGYRYNTATTGQSGMFGLSYIIGSDLFRLTAVGGRTQNQLGYLPVPKPLADQDPRTNVNDSSYHDDFGQYLVQAEFTHAFDAHTALSAMVYAGGAGGDYFAGYRDSVGVLTQINYPLQNRHYGVLGTMTMDDVASGLDLTAGLHAYMFNRRNWETISPENTRPYYEDSTSKREVSGFAKASWTLGGDSYPHTVLQADLQARYVQMQFMPDPRSVAAGTTIPDHAWFFLNPRTGVTYALSERQQLYASIGRTGREPTRFDLLGGTQITAANIDVLLNPHTVRPEYVTDIEFGWRKEALSIDGHSKLLAQVNGFLMLFSDEIAPVGEYIDQYFVQLRTNVKQSMRYGLEIDLGWQIIDELRVDVNATGMGATIKEVFIASADTTVHNVHPVLTPDVIANAKLAWDPINWLGFDLGVRRVSSSYLELTNNSSLMLDAFQVYDAAARVVLSHVRFTFRLNNILDQHYATNGGVDYSAGAPSPSVFMQAGRNFWMMLEISL